MEGRVGGSRGGWGCRGVRGGLTILPSLMPGKFELSKQKKNILVGGWWGVGGGVETGGGG